MAMHPKDILIQDYTYHLPDEKIARYPLPKRDMARLLVYKTGQMLEDKYSNIASHLPQQALLVFNNTRVVEARLLFQKLSGGIIEIFILETPDSATMDQPEKVLCKCLIGGAGKWKHGQVMQKHATVNGTTLVLEAAITDKFTDSFMIEFKWQPAAFAFKEVLNACGIMPIPPYLKRAADASDIERYQTVFARYNGSVAAPTAGLHFTPEVFQSCIDKNIDTGFITLHVGAGTFMPVKSKAMQGHDMHAEYLVIDPEMLLQLIKARGNVFAVGTTTLRTLESIYWMGSKCLLNPSITTDELEIKQWEVYDELANQNIEVDDALYALLNWMKQNVMQKLYIKTQILIAPGYRTRMIKGLITNFHQPGSTLVLLVAALIGENWRRVYDYALQNNFRFLSYGDGCLLFLH